MKNNCLESLNKVLEKITDIYIFAIIVIFPLLIDSTGFFKVLEYKYVSYIGISISYIFLILFVLIYYYFFRNINIFKKLKIDKLRLILLVFLIINIISCFISPYFNKYNLFIGVGRGEGLIAISLYIISFLCISFFGKFKKDYIYLFSISSILFNFICLLQFFGFNPFNIFQDGIGIHNVSFMGTIGNVDFISAYFCIVMSISIAAYIFLEEDKKHKIIHLISVLMGYMIFQVINVNSGRVGFIITFIIFAPFVILDNKRFSRFLKIFSIIMLAYFLNLTINPEYHYNVGKVLLYFKFNLINLIFIILSVVFSLLSYILNKYDYNYVKKKNVIIFYSLVLLLLIVVLICIYAIDFGPEFKVIYEINQILHGNYKDEFGTYRMFLWKRAVNLISDYPLIGTGPDTFAPRFMNKYTNDVINLNGHLTINDTSANVYLTMCINIGLIGLLFYILFLYGLLKKTFKKYNAYSFVILTGVICYIIQDFFNLWVLIVTPIFWVTMALYYISLNDINQDLIKGGK